MTTNTIFFNQVFDKKRLKVLISWVFKEFGEKEALRVVEELKTIGFHNATRAGLSIGLNDLTTPSQKPSLLSKAELDMIVCDQDFTGGHITATERNQRIVDTWHRVSETLRKQVVEHFSTYDQLNPVYIMALSGARGNFSQVRQLVGMRGLMADPQGQIISFPIRSNLREGLTLTEYFISCSGARKGLVDTALRTADTGYLTRRLVDVSHHIVIKKICCNTEKGIYIRSIKSENKVLLSLSDRLIGRVLAQNVEYSSTANREDQKSVLSSSDPFERSNVIEDKSSKLPLDTPSEGIHQSLTTLRLKQENSSLKTVKLLAQKNQEIDPILAFKLQTVKEEVMIRSPLTCALTHSVCQLCYGWSLSQGRLVSLGEAVGVIAAQSIGEPGTQLTMRTFHTGGVFSGDLLQEIRAPHSGKIEFSKAFQGLLIRTTDGRIAFLTKTSGEIILKSNPIATKRETPYPVASIPPSSLSRESLPSVYRVRKGLGGGQLSKESSLTAKAFDEYKNSKAKVSFTTNKLEETNKQTCLQFQALSLLFVRQAEYVSKNQLLAQISILGEEGNQPIKSRQTIFAEISGKVFETQGAVSSKKFIKNINKLNKNVETTVFKHELVNTLKGRALNSIQPEKSAKLGFFHILATQIAATFGTKRHETSVSPNNRTKLLDNNTKSIALDKSLSSWKYPQDTLSPEGKPLLTPSFLPGRFREKAKKGVSKLPFGRPGVGSVSFSRRLTAQEKGLWNTEQPFDSQRGYAVSQAKSEKPTAEESLEYNPDGLRPSESKDHLQVARKQFGIPILKNSRKIQSSQQSYHTLHNKACYNPYTAQFFSSTHNKNVIVDLLRKKFSKVKKVKLLHSSTSWSMIETQIGSRKTPYYTKNKNTSVVSNLTTSLQPAKFQDLESITNVSSYTVFKESELSDQNQQISDSFFLQTIAQEGDLVDSDYKNYLS